MIKNTLWILFLLLVTSCSEKKPQNLVKNPSFEKLDERGQVAEWLTSRHAGDLAYTFTLDSNKVHNGKSSFKIEQYKKQGYGIVNQLINLTENNKSKMIFSAKIFTKDIVLGKGVQLVVNFKSEDGYIFKQVKSDSLTGSNDWINLSVEEIIPKGTKILEAGIMLQSIGTVWIDNVTLKLE